MEHLPLISVIVPVYKVENYLDRCVRSLVEQTYRNLEIILVDDGSPDNSGAICDAWAAKDSRIRVIHQSNAGAGAARNVALDEAKGEFVGMVDSDDYLSPEMYQHLYELMQNDVDIAECEIGLTEDDDFVMDKAGSGDVTVCGTWEAMALHIQDKLFCQTPPNKLYRKTSIGEIRFPVGNLIDDEFFTYRVIAQCRRLAHSHCRLYAYRQQGGSAMHKPYSLRRLDGIRAKQERLVFLGKEMPELVTLAKQDLFFTCLYGMQGSLRWLSTDEMKTARRILKEALDKAAPLPGGDGLSAGKKGLLVLGKLSLEGAARCLNFLEDVHILR